MARILQHRTTLHWREPETLPLPQMQIVSETDPGNGADGDSSCDTLRLTYLPEAAEHRMCRRWATIDSDHAALSVTPGLVTQELMSPSKDTSAQCLAETGLP